MPKHGGHFTFVFVLAIMPILLAVSAFSADLKIETTAVLTASQQKEFDSLATSFRIPSCGPLSLAEGLEHKPPCRMAVYLAPFARWLVAKGKTFDETIKDCAARRDGMDTGARFPIDLTAIPIAGDETAPVTIVVYISAMCPLCKYLTSDIYREVTSGALKGKARLSAKPFSAGVGDRALLAAAYYGKYWDYIIALNNIKMRPDVPILLRVADSLGMPKDAFEKLLADTSIMQNLASFRKEGERVGVTMTPTFFIGGKRYRSYKDPHWVVDAALYENETLLKENH
jgi:protein-disulfide isomerase